jgi:hypothetical protein
MKILCSLSGLEFTCEHFPGTFYSKETYHPIFHIEQKKLLVYLKKWAGNELTPTDSYLLFLALLKSSDLVEFRVPVFRTEKTDSIIYNNMEYLARTVIKLNTVSNPGVIFPHYVITPDTRFLTNIHHWIENWEKEYEDFLNGKRKDIQDRKLVQREAALARLIKNPHKAVSAYATEIAAWASVAGSFPVFTINSPFKDQGKVELKDYWKEIIVRCCRNELLFSIPKKDLDELLEHCEDHVPVGSIYSNALFKVLRTAHEKHKNFLSLGEYDIKSTYSLLSQEDTAEAANIKSMIDQAPEEEPRMEQYPTKFKYLQAKLRWDMAKRYGRNEVQL